MRGQAIEMISITICVGSSCHVRGSHNVIKLYSSLLEELNLKEKVELKGCFCMERCTTGMNLKIDDEYHSIASIEEAQALFDEKVVRVLGIGG
jgi:NADH:ubiquinone oxidoreductase subunit E